MVPARRALAAALAALSAATVLAACSTVDGSGTIASRGPSSGQSAPSAQPSADGSGPMIPSSVPGSGGPEAYTCPVARFPDADLSFECITNDMTRGSNPVFPTVLAKRVEAGTGWQLETGAVRYNRGAGDAKAIVAAISRTQESFGSYGEKPTTTSVERVTRAVGDRPAYLAVDDIRLNPTWARTEGTKVQVERRWLLVVEVTTDNFSVFFASIPDLEKRLWPSMAGVLESVKIL